jgi:hypothetical protein
LKTHAHRLAKRAALALATKGGPATPVTLKWIEWTGATTTDPVTGSKLGTKVDKTSTVNAFVHFVQPAATGVRQFNEIEHGDCIVDFSPDAPLDGKEELRFEIAGALWVQKTVGRTLATTWDTLVGGQKIFRTVLLRKAT